MSSTSSGCSTEHDRCTEGHDGNNEEKGKYFLQATEPRIYFVGVPYGINEMPEKESED